MKIKTKHDNKGFTLVELIVVIVILAILVGVTIAGVMGYVQKARINTDINNAAAIESALATLTTDKDVCKWAEEKDASGNYKEKELVFAWGYSSIGFEPDYSRTGEPTIFSLPKDSAGDPKPYYLPYTFKFKNEPITSLHNSTVIKAMSKLETVFPDGLPKSKSGNWYAITLGAKNGSPYAICKVYTPAYADGSGFSTDGEPTKTCKLGDLVQGKEE